MAETHAGHSTTALHTTRRWFVVSVVTVLVATTTIAGALRWDELSDPQRIVLIVAVVLTCIGVAGSRRARDQWFAIGALALLSVASALGGPAETRWLAMPNLLANAAYLAIILSGRRLGLLWAAIGTVGFASVLVVRPGSVIMWAPEPPLGWIAVGQVLAACLLVWLTWHRLVDRSMRDDQAQEREQQRTMAAIAAQERSRVWRSAATSLHESVLNTIRYVLTMEPLDRQRLGTMIVSTAGMAEVTGRTLPRTELAALIESAVVESGHANRVDVVTEVPDVVLSLEAESALRAAIVEVVRNAMVHGHATSVTVRAEADDAASLRIVVDDDGSGMSADARPGYGLSQVLGAGLIQIGATVRIEQLAAGVRATITLPSAERRIAAAQPSDSFDSGRILLSAVLAGSVGVGWLIYLALIATGRPADMVAAALGITATFVAVWWFIRGTRRRALIALPIVLAAAAVPWIAGIDLPGCAWSPVLASALNVAGYTIIVLALWAGRVIGGVGLTTWAIGGIALITQVPSGCRAPLLLAEFNSLLFVSIVMVVVHAATRAHQRAQERMEAMRIRALAESARADSTQQLNTRLSFVVSSVLDTFTQIAEGAPLDDGRRHDLLMADARIRAVMQVDPGASGAVALLASDLVEAAVRSGSGVIVRAIASSGDRTMIPEPVAAALLDVVQAGAGAEVTVQAFTDDEHDRLTLLVPRIPEHARQALSRHCPFGCRVELVEPDDGPSMVLLERQIASNVVPA